MTVKIFYCKLCEQKGKGFYSSRKGLRQHLAKEHIRNKELTNSGSSVTTYYNENLKKHIKQRIYHKQKWWGEATFDES